MDQLLGREGEGLKRGLVLPVFGAMICLIALGAFTSPGAHAAKPKLADLKLRSGSASLASGVLTGSITVQNSGKKRAAASKAAITWKGPGKSSPIGELSTPSLGPGRSATTRFRITLPASPAPGTYTVTACADATSKVREVRESNNCRRIGSVTITAPPPIDTTAPDTTINTGPTGTISTDQATFTFAGNPSGDTAKIQCRIDSQPFADCSTPKTFTALTEGPHTATFRAEDAAGNQDQTPATRTFTVDTTPPDTTINTGSGPDDLNRPGHLHLRRQPERRHRQDPVPDHPASFADCSTPKTFTALTEGPHTATFRAEDAAGNQDQTPATRTFTVDTTPPDTTINTGPTGTISTDQATFTFAGNPSGDTAKIQCRIDSQPFADCSTPKTFTALTEGPHTATFRAEDAAGNQDQTPATRTFTVDTTPPDTTINTGPTGTITTDQATFTFAGNPAGETAKIQCRIDDGAFADCPSPKTFTGLADGSTPPPSEPRTQPETRTRPRPPAPSQSTQPRLTPRRRRQQSPTHPPGGYRPRRWISPSPPARSEALSNAASTARLSAPAPHPLPHHLAKPLTSQPQGKGD